MPRSFDSLSLLSRTGSIRTVLVSCLWAAALAVGFRQLIQYEVTPGSAGRSPAEWPASAPVKFDPTRSHLLMFAHPECPCTRASLSELLKVLTQAHGTIKATVLFDVPHDASDWRKERLCRTAAAIPGVEVVPDPDGVWAKQFGAETSGYTVLFDRTGHLVFRGGITGARGHEGDNAGETTVVSLALASKAPTASASASAAVFGCPLTGPTRPAQEIP